MRISVLQLFHASSMLPNFADSTMPVHRTTLTTRPFARYRREEKTLSATIEKGMPDGEDIVFKYESEQKPGQVSAFSLFTPRQPSSGGLNPA